MYSYVRLAPFPGRTEEGPFVLHALQWTNLYSKEPAPFRRGLFTSGSTSKNGANMIKANTLSDRHFLKEQRP